MLQEILRRDYYLLIMLVIGIAAVRRTAMVESRASAAAQPQNDR